MRAFYIAFSNWNAVRSNLSWTHYRMLLKVEDEKARKFNLDECTKTNWSTRQLEHQFNSFYPDSVVLGKNSSMQRFSEFLSGPFQDLLHRIGDPTVNHING